MNSTGRGRLKVSSQESRFTYQAAVKDLDYTLGIDIPFKGQETLTLPLASKKNLGGSLYQKVSKSLLKKRKLKAVQLFDDFLLQSAKFFDGISKIQNSQCSDSQCLNGQILKTDKGEQFRSAWSDEYELVIDFGRLRSGMYQSIRVKALHMKSKKNPLSLDLALDSCQ